MGKFDGMDPKLVRELLAEVKRAAAELRGVEGRVAQAMTRADLATRTTHRPSQVADAGDKMIRDVTVRLGELEKRADHPRTNGTTDDHAPTAIGDATKDHPADQPDNGDKNDKGAKSDKPHADATTPAQPKPDDHPRNTEDPKHPAKPDTDAKKDPDAKTGHDTKPDDKPDAKPERDAKPDDKPDAKPEQDAKPDDKPDAKPEQDVKPDDKPERDAKPGACDDVEPDAPKDPDPGSEKGGVDLPDQGVDSPDQSVDVPDQRVDVPDQGVDLPDQGTHDAAVKSPPPGGDPSKPQVVVVDGVKVLQVPIDPPTAEELQNLLRNLDGVQPADMPTPVGDSTPDVPDAYGNHGGDAVSVNANPADQGGVHAATGDAVQLQPYGMPDTDTTLPTHPATADAANTPSSGDGRHLQPYGMPDRDTTLPTHPATAPDTPSSDAACQQPDTGTGQPPGGQPDRGTGQPDVGAGHPSGGQPDTGTGQPAGGQPSGGQPDTGTGQPSGGRPDTGTGRPTVIPPTLPAADGGGAVGTHGQGVSAAPSGHGGVVTGGYGNDGSVLPGADGGVAPGTHGTDGSAPPRADAGAVPGTHGPVPSQDGGAVTGDYGKDGSVGSGTEAGAVPGSRADGMVPGGKGDEGVYLPEVDGEGNVVVRAGAGNDVVSVTMGPADPGALTETGEDARPGIQVTAGDHGEVASVHVAAEGPPGTAGDGTPERSA